MNARRTMLAVACVLSVVVSLAWQRAYATAKQDADDPAQSASPAHGAASASGATIKVYTRETVVDVTVTDKDGKPVRGLTRADFIVTEDSKPQSIRSFKEFFKDTPVTASTPRKLPPHTYTNQQPSSQTSAEIVIMLGNLSCLDLYYSVKGIEKYLRNMPDGSRVALFYNAHLLQGFTFDPERLLVALNAVTCVVPDDQLNAFDVVAAYVSGDKGKKNLIWFTDGIAGVTDPQFNGPDRSSELQRTYDLLAASQVTVYPIQGTCVTNYAAAPPTDSRGNPVAGAQAAATYVARFKVYAGAQLSLESVAEATGGEAFYNTNDLSTALAQAVENGSDYYTLSYAPPSVEYDGRYHAIKIKVDRPDVHLLYRKGYSAEDPTLLAHPPETLFGHVTRDTRPTGPVADPLAVALSPIAPPATQLLFDVRVEPSMDPENPFDPPVFGVLDPKFKKAPLTRYGLLFAVPQNQIAFADAGGGTYSGSLKFDIAAFDADDKMVSSRSQTMKLPLTNDEYQQFIAAPFQLYQQLDLPPGEFMLRVGVLDGVSNKLGTVQIPLTVGKKKAATKLNAAASSPASNPVTGEKDGK